MKRARKKLEKLEKLERKLERRKLEQESTDLREAGQRVAEERHLQKERIVAAALARENARGLNDLPALYRAEADLIEAVRGLK